METNQLSSSRAGKIFHAPDPDEFYNEHVFLGLRPLLVRLKTEH
jgi:hypothetical protein